MFNSLRDQLLEQEVVFEQYRAGDGQAPANQPPVEGAVTNVTSATLSATRVGNVVNVEAPQALGPTSDPTFNTINVVDDSTTRDNLGLGEMAIADRIAAITDLAQTISNPPTQTEVQDISNKIDELFAAMRAAAHLVP
jgi:hypothetical protein